MKRTPAALLLLLVAALFVPAWLASPHVLGTAAELLLALGLERAAFGLAALGTPEEVPDPDLAVYAAMADLEPTPRRNEAGTVELWLPAGALDDAALQRALTLLEAARTEVGAYVGTTPAVLRVRAPRELLPQHLGRFDGLFVDLRTDTLLEAPYVYHEVTHAALLSAVLTRGLPTDLPPWLDEGLAEYVPSALQKAPDYRLFRASKGSPLPTWRTLDRYTVATRDYFPACTAVALLIERSGGPAALPRLLDRIRSGDHFPQALARGCSTSERAFAPTWSELFRTEFVDKEDRPDFLLLRAREMADAGNTTIAWVYLHRLPPEARDLPEANELRARVLYDEARRFLTDRQHRVAAERFRLCLKAIERLPAGETRDALRPVESDARVRQGQCLMAAAAEPRAGRSADGAPLRGNGALVRLVIPPALMLALLLGLGLLRWVAVPLLVLVWTVITRPGAVFSPCLALLAVAFAFKLGCGGGLTLLQAGGQDEPTLSRAGQYLLYVWLTALAMWAVGGRVFRACGGEDHGGVAPLGAAFVVHLAVLGGFAAGLWRLGALRATEMVAPLALLHAVLLAFVLATAEENLFRGGLFKSAEVNLHVGAAAVLSSSFWALYHAGPRAPWSHLGASFAFGLLLCGLVARTGRLGTAVGAGAAVHLVDWLLLGADGDPFWLGLLTAGRGGSPWASEAGFGCGAMAPWLPVLLVAWVVTLYVAHGTGVSRNPRIYDSLGRYR